MGQVTIRHTVNSRFRHSQVRHTFSFGTKIYTLVPEAWAWQIGGPSATFHRRSVIYTLGAPTGKIPGEGYAKPRAYLAPLPYSRMHLLPVLDHKDVYKTE
jgi:hypothetical protein